MTSDRGNSGAAELELNNTPVTPKLPGGLNPNATVFLSHKSSPAQTDGQSGSPDTGQTWDQQNDSGIGTSTNSVSDYSFANGDVTVDRTETAVFSPGSESPFHPEFTPFTDNQTLNENNANVSMKTIETEPGTGMGNLILDNASGYNSSSSATGYNSATETTTVTPSTPNFPASGSDVSVPMQDVQYTSENGSITDGESQTSVEGNVPVDQLRHMLKNQLETYFSRENLSNDSYLQSQMDADQYVPIATVAGLDQIQRLTTDLHLIVELLRESTFVQVDEKGEKVRPNHNRCIVILREIPDSTPVQDVQNLFSGQNCPKFVSCEFAHNSNWYVTFDSDADAQRAYQYLREEVRTFLGKPIMARIKAKPLIRTYQPRNGYINKRYQSAPQVSTQQIAPEPVTPSSTASQQQFTATPPYPLMPNVSQSLYGQQAIPFYPPPNQLLQPTWAAAPNTAMLGDPGVVLAMNGYQATNVKVNNQGAVPPNRNMYNNVNTRGNNNRNQNKSMGGNQSMGRERINSNDSLPPRLQHQQERQQNALNNNHPPQHHKTNHQNHQISNHPPIYPGRRGDHTHTPGGGHSMPPHAGSHSNHNHINHHGGGPGMGGGPHGGPPGAPHGGPHHSGGPPHHSGPHSSGGGGPGGVPMSHHHHAHHTMPHHAQQQQQQHLDGNNNTSNNSNGVMNSRLPSTATQPPSDRYNAGYSDNYKGYRSRRRREDDGARPMGGPREGGPPMPGGRPLPIDKFDYEPTMFPPLPGAESNTASGEVFESKLSDVVKGTAKPVVRDTPAPSNKASSPSTTPPNQPSPANTMATTTTSSMSVSNTVASSKLPSTSPSQAKEAVIQPVQAVAQQASSPAATGPVGAGNQGVATVTRVSAPPPQQQPPVSSQTSRSSKNVQQQQSVPESNCEKQHSQTILDEKSSMSQQQQAPNSVKLSYAQMVQKAKVAEVSANSLADRSDDSDYEDAVDSSTTTASSNRALKEQGQQQSSGSKQQTARGSGKDFAAKKDSNSMNYDNEARRDNYNEFKGSKENDCRRDEPREQRANRRLKENRERRFVGDRGDRDTGRRGDTRRPDHRDGGGALREQRDGIKASVAK